MVCWSPGGNRHWGEAYPSANSSSVPLSSLSAIDQRGRHFRRSGGSVRSDLPEDGDERPQEKRNQFERFGVREYFIVHPDRQYVEKYTLDAGIYKKPELHEEDETFRVDTIGLELKARDLFAFPE